MTISRKTFIWILFLISVMFPTGMLLGYAIPRPVEQVEPVIVYIHDPLGYRLIPKPEPVEQFIIPVTEAEIDLLSRLVSAEAKGESYEGMIAVANVVLNRLRSPKWKADTIYEVIYQPKQFQPVDNGSINDEATEKAFRATMDALRGTTIVSDEVDCFARVGINFSSWAEYNVTIGNHDFWVAK